VSRKLWHALLLTPFVGATHARTATAQAQRSAVISADSLQRIVDDRVRAGRTPGLIVGIINGDGTRAVAASGFARPDVRVTDQTLFEIGSITKAFTGVLLAEMVGRGEVRYDQPVAELLPPGTKVPARSGRLITLVDLATQTSGLPRLPDNMRQADPENPYADYTVAQMYDFLGRHELRRDPGATYEYSNLGVGLLGHALALRAGKSYETLLRERVLVPLGMNSTAIALSPAQQARVSQGHTADGDVTPLWDLPTLAGAGALRSSMQDMLRFLAANIQPPDSPLGRAIAASHDHRFRSNAAISLGLNWHRLFFRNDTIVFHNGGTGGFRTMLAWNTATRAGAVLLGNASNDNEDIVRHLLSGMPLATIASRPEVHLAADVLDTYVGKYEFAPTFAITVTRVGDQLFAQATGQPRFRIFAEAKDRFFLRTVDAQLEFERDSTGAVTVMTLVQNGARQRAPRIRD
jgi:D-alanyl-D-alanine-carboxypeptidase/D-alanyl-D-alanine-endopeptidase